MIKKYRYLLIPIICTLAFFLLFRVVFLIGYVPSSSMEPTLKEGSMILGLRLYDELRTGDIVIFRHDGQLLIKRIAASPGEFVEHCGRTLTVPDRCYYLLGDNFSNSYDSRYWDIPFVPIESIVAKLILPANTYN